MGERAPRKTDSGVQDAGGKLQGGRDGGNAWGGGRGSLKTFDRRRRRRDDRYTEASSQPMTREQACWLFATY